MAKLRKQILGKISGAFGDIVFRNTRKTNYVVARPSNYNAPMDKAALNRRGKFAVSVKLSSLLLSSNEMKKIWSRVTPNGQNIFNYLVRNFYPLVNMDGLTEQIQLTPPLGFIVQTDSVTIKNDKVTVITQPIDQRSGIDVEVEKSIKLISVVSLSNPAVDNMNDFMFLKFESDVKQLNLIDPITFEIGITNQITDLLSKYSNKLFLFSAVTLDVNNEPVNYSSTFIYRQ